MNDALKNIDMPTLIKLVETQGKWLAQQQPRRALDEIADMQQVFETCTSHVRHELQTALATMTPGIPLSNAEFDLEVQIRPERPAYWVADAIDGAVQYLCGLPLWTITLCLVQDSKPVLAVVHDAANACTYHAQAGLGAYCNDNPLRVATRSAIEAAFIGTSFPNYPQRPKAEIDDFLLRMASIIPRVFAQRWMGPASLSLSQLAEGKLDGYWETGRSLYDWLPGALIAQEAGARVRGLDGRTFDWDCNGILAASPAMYPQLEKLLAK
ncbi:MAG: inositol monophosphatase [Burkholderiales bacterium]|nr:inositol monophosphatase [Burkholderiales bacterium]